MSFLESASSWGAQRWWNCCQFQVRNGSFVEYDLSKGEFLSRPCFSHRSNPVIKEVLWFTKISSNSSEVLNSKYNVHYWNDWWDTLGTIGELLAWSLRNTTSSIRFSNSWKPTPGMQYHLALDYQAFWRSIAFGPSMRLSDHAWCPVDIYLMRPNYVRMICWWPTTSMQYLQMMIAKHFGWKEFLLHQQPHIHDNQFEQAEIGFVVSRQTANHAWF